MAVNTKRTSAYNVPADNTNIEMEQKIKANNTIINKKGAQKKLMESEKVPVSISPLYAPEFSDNMCVTINGYSIYVPCDGQRYMVSKPFADEINRRIIAADDKARTGAKMSDVKNNFEQFAGAGNFIKKA